MFRGLRDKIALYRLSLREKKVDAEEERIRKKAKEDKNAHLLDDWYESFGSWEYEEIEWSRKRIVSDSLIREADELHVPRPKHGDKDKWEKDKPLLAPGNVLTPEAMVEVRSAIRKEKRERRETVEWWLKIIGGIITIGTGLVGALIGLVSVWKHK